jgi:hypothetical protein
MIWAKRRFKFADMLYARNGFGSSGDETADALSGHHCLLPIVALASERSEQRSLYQRPDAPIPERPQRWDRTFLYEYLIE